jgi:hypothetical protein
MSKLPFEEEHNSHDWEHDEEANTRLYISEHSDHGEHEDSEDEETKNEFKDSNTKYHQVDDPNVPSWLKEDLLASSHNPVSIMKKPKSTIKYKQPKPSVKNKRSHSGGFSCFGFRCGCCPDDPVLYYFRVFHSFCILVGVLAFISNLYVLLDIFLDLRNIVIHLYALFLCLVIIAAEFDLSMLLLRIQLFDSWMFRGVFYVFVGVISGKHLISLLSLFPDLSAVPLTLCFFISYKRRR